VNGQAPTAEHLEAIVMRARRAEASQLDILHLCDAAEELVAQRDVVDAAPAIIQILEDEGYFGDPDYPEAETFRMAVAAVVSGTPEDAL
jgi:hypothetical protein